MDSFDRTKPDNQKIGESISRFMKFLGNYNQGAFLAGEPILSHEEGEKIWNSLSLEEREHYSLEAGYPRLSRFAEKLEEALDQLDLVF